MIGIYQNREIYINKSNLVAKHWENIQKLSYSRYYLKKEDNYENLDFDKFKNLLLNINIDFEDVVKADINRIKNIYLENDIKDSINSLQIYKNNKSEDQYTEINIFDELYKEFRKKYGMEYVNNLKLSVCPYCNRNYINSGKKVTMAEFDHFYPKSKYPHLALSFFNLVPCCHTCNHTKHNKTINVNPHDDKYSTDNIIQFDYVPIPSNKENKNDYEIGVESLNDDMNDNIKVFQLKEQYAIHKNIIDDMKLKAEIFNEVYKDSLRKILDNSSIDRSIEEVYYESYFKEDKYYLSPLSKFKHDIYCQIKKR